MPCPGNVIGLGRNDCAVLLKAGQSGTEVAGKPQSTKKEDALSVIHVTPHLADAPLRRRIAIERFFFRDAAQKRNRFVQLRMQRVEDIFAGNTIDVTEIIWSSFVGCGASDHENNGSSMGRTERGAR